jgi:hypothetical protein
VSFFNLIEEHNGVRLCAGPRGMACSYVARRCLSGG